MEGMHPTEKVQKHFRDAHRLVGQLRDAAKANRIDRDNLNKGLALVHMLDNQTLMAAAAAQTHEHRENERLREKIRTVESLRARERQRLAAARAERAAVEQRTEVEPERRAPVIGGTIPAWMRRPGQP